MHNRGRTLCLITTLVCLMGGTTSWGQQTYNPTASDPATQNTAGGTGALPSNSGYANTAFGLDVLASNTAGYANTALGIQALRFNTTGFANTASGTGALGSNTTGYANAATGYGVLRFNTTGFANTAGGYEALFNNTTGFANTASGHEALFKNTTGQRNTATGAGALHSNTTGIANTASGHEALWYNTTGSRNTAGGFDALNSNTTGYANTADGVDALRTNTTGFRNTALGVQTLLNNTTGSHNTALGYTALLAGTGSRNTALGWGAGSSLTSGNDNIYLGHPGAASESKTMRLGTPAVQTRAFVAGITGVPITGSQVLVNGNGQLGILASSARYKRDIEDLRERSADIYKLRPVTFRYKDDTENRLQYGLIAEEVAKVYPELVTTGADGTIESVQYHALIPLLLNEVQRQQHELAELRAQNDRLQATLTAQQATFAARLERLEAAEVRTTLTQR